MNKYLQQFGKLSAEEADQVVVALIAVFFDYVLAQVCLLSLEFFTQVIEVLFYFKAKQ